MALLKCRFNFKAQRELKALVWNMYAEAITPLQRKRMLCGDIAEWLLSRLDTYCAVIMTTGANGTWQKLDEVQLTECLHAMSCTTASILASAAGGGANGDDDANSGDDEVTGFDPKSQGKHVFVETMGFIAAIQDVVAARGGQRFPTDLVTELMWWLHAGSGYKELMKENELPYLIHLEDHCASMYGCIRRMLQADIHNFSRKIMLSLARKAAGDLEALRREIHLDDARWRVDEVACDVLLKHFKTLRVFVLPCHWRKEGSRDYAGFVVRKALGFRYSTVLPHVVQVPRLLVGLLQGPGVADKVADEDD